MFIIQYAIREVKIKHHYKKISGDNYHSLTISDTGSGIFFQTEFGFTYTFRVCFCLKVFSYRLAVRHRGQACLSGTVQVGAGLRGLACHSGASCGHKATAAEPVSTRHTQQDSQAWYILCNGRPEKEVIRERRTGTFKEETANCQLNISTLFVQKSLTFSRGKGIFYSLCPLSKPNLTAQINPSQGSHNFQVI